MIYVADFETTVYEGQEYTEVWASALVALWSEHVHVWNNISDLFDYLFSLNENSVVYFHNLKFDGSFILDYFIRQLGWQQALTGTLDEENMTGVKFERPRYMPKESLSYVISDKGSWYTITLKYNKNNYVEIRDSLKLLPFSVKRIGKSFETKHKKTEIEYEGYRTAYGKITDEEREYIANDVLVIKEALEIMQQRGHDKLTIGACCYSEFKKGYSRSEFSEMFPDLSGPTNFKDRFNLPLTIDGYIRKSYRGGWCYLKKGYEGIVYHNGFTADVNSLYPSVMSSESLNRYPIGKPTFWEGNYIPKEAQKFNRYYFVRLKTEFKLKDGYLPFLQIKDTLQYPANECLERSDINLDGRVIEHRPLITMTQTDYQLFNEHYYLYNTQILDGCYFDTDIGIFDDYMLKYKEIKMNSKGAERELAKLYLNNLYGKTATSDISSFKVAYVKDNGVLGFYTVEEHDKTLGYIPVGSAITSYAREFTIRAAQKNYDKFIYADTDSIHCLGDYQDVVDVPEHDTDFCHWKIESFWDEAIFTRQKTYIEHVTHTNKKKLDNPYYNIKCAGMPARANELLNANLSGIEIECKTENERKFMSKKLTLEDYKPGLLVAGSLKPKRVKGGIILKDDFYEMRAK